MKLANNILAIFSVSTIFALTFAAGAHDIAPGFGMDTTVFCRDKLQQIAIHDLGAFSESFSTRRTYALLRDPTATGKMSESVASALELGTTLNDKSAFLKKMWWSENTSLIKPNLRGIPRSDAKRLREHGVSVPKYQGDMLFKGEQADARISMSIVDAVKAADSLQLAKQDSLKNTASLDIILHDRKGAISESSFRAWARMLMTDAQLNGQIDDATTPSNQKSRRPTYELVSEKRGDGITEYSLKIRNVYLPFRRLLWLIEGAQRSLAPKDYRQTRDEMELTLGIPAHRSGEAPATPFTNPSQQMRVAEYLDENYEYSAPEPRRSQYDGEEDRRQQQGRKNPKSFDRNSRRTER